MSAKITRNPRSTLTQKQKDFTLNIFSGLSQAKSYIEAYHPRYSLRTIEANASRLANNEKVLIYLRELQDKAESDKIADVKERKERLSQYVRANITDYMDSEGNITLEKNSEAVAELIIEDWQGLGDVSRSRKKRIKLHSPLQAIDILNKMDKIYSEMSTGYQDNRVINIIVSSEKAKELTENVAKRFKEIEASR